MGEILRIEGLCRHFTGSGMFGSRGGTVRAVDGVSFGLEKGDVLVLAGQSGSGKSTIARLILGSIKADSGSVFFEGERVTGKAGLEKIRAQCQMIHQDPYDSINPGMRVSDIICEPLGIHGWGRKDARKRAIEVLGEVRLEPASQIGAKYPHMLSGGQRQRVVLARALALRPKVIIADEPVSMLDVSVRAEMLELMSEMQKKYDISFLYITHDLATARYFGKRIAILYMGRIVETGPIDEVLARPHHPYTRALIDAIPGPDPENLDRERIIRIGEPRKVDAYTGCRFRARCPHVMEKCMEEPELVRDGERSVACFADI